MYSKILSAKCPSSCLGLNVLPCQPCQNREVVGSSPTKGELFSISENFENNPSAVENGAVTRTCLAFHLLTFTNTILCSWNHCKLCMFEIPKRLLWLGLLTLIIHSTNRFHEISKMQHSHLEHLHQLSFGSRPGKNVSISRFYTHDDIIEWKHFPRYFPFVRGSAGHR